MYKIRDSKLVSSGPSHPPSPAYFNVVTEPTNPAYFSSRLLNKTDQNPCLVGIYSPAASERLCVVYDQIILAGVGNLGRQVFFHQRLVLF